MKSKKIIFLGLTLVVLNYCLPLSAVCKNKWTGVDESVVEKYAKEHGREKQKSLIDTDQGDLLLYVFLLAVVLGGFIWWSSTPMAPWRRPSMCLA